MKKNNLRGKVSHNLQNLTCKKFRIFSFKVAYLAQFSVDISNLDSKIQFRCFLVKIKEMIKQWTLFFEHPVIMKNLPK